MLGTARTTSFHGVAGRGWVPRAEAVRCKARHGLARNHKLPGPGTAWSGNAGQRAARHVETTSGLAMQGDVRQGQGPQTCKARRGRYRMVMHGDAQQDGAWSGAARAPQQACWARIGKPRSCMAMQGKDHKLPRRGAVRQAMAMHGSAWSGMAGNNQASTARRGLAWRDRYGRVGSAMYGEVRQGEDYKLPRIGSVVRG